MRGLGNDIKGELSPSHQCKTLCIELLHENQEIAAIRISKIIKYTIYQNQNVQTFTSRNFCLAKSKYKCQHLPPNNFK